MNIPPLSSRSLKTVSVLHKTLRSKQQDRLVTFRRPSKPPALQDPRGELKIRVTYTDGSRVGGAKTRSYFGGNINIR